MFVHSAKIPLEDAGHQKKVLAIQGGLDPGVGGSGETLPGRQGRQTPKGAAADEVRPPPWRQVGLGPPICRRSRTADLMEASTEERRSRDGRAEEGPRKIVIGIVQTVHPHTTAEAVSALHNHGGARDMDGFDSTIQL